MGDIQIHETPSTHNLDQIVHKTEGPTDIDEAVAICIKVIEGGMQLCLSEQLLVLQDADDKLMVVDAVVAIDVHELQQLADLVLGQLYGDVKRSVLSY